MIGIVVAVIVAAVVLVPICNSLTEGDGGSGGEGDNNPILVNNYKDYYEAWGIDTSLMGTMVYTPDKYPELPFTIDLDLDDLNQKSELVKPATDDTYDFPIQYVTLDYLSVGGDDLQALVFFRMFEGEQTKVWCGGGSGESSFSPRPTSEFLSYHLVVNSDYSATLDYVTDNNRTVSVSGNIDEIKIATEDIVNGWVNINGGYANEGEVFGPIYVSSGTVLKFRCFVGLNDYYGNSDISYTVSKEDISNNKITINTDIPFEENEGSAAVKISMDLTSTDRTGISRIVGNDYNMIVVEVLSPDPNEEWYSVSSIYNVSMLNTNPDAGETVGDVSDTPSSSAGNDLGVAGTIIGIIPVFVILAILMGAAGLFYQNRKAI